MFIYWCVCGFAVQKNVVTGEVCATLLFCNIFQTDSTRGNNLKQEKRVPYCHLYIQCLPAPYAGMKVLNFSGSYLHTQVVFAPF